MGKGRDTRDSLADAIFELLIQGEREAKHAKMLGGKVKRGTRRSSTAIYLAEGLLRLLPEYGLRVVDDDV